MDIEHIRGCCESSSVEGKVLCEHTYKTHIFHHSLLLFPSPIVDHVVPEPESSLIEAYEKWREWGDGKACCDYSLHVDITLWNDSVKQEVQTLIKEKGLSLPEASFCF